MDLVIQMNLMSEDTLRNINAAVQDIPHVYVGLIPFSREITSNTDIDGIDHIPYGSTSFIETTHGLGWKGLSFDPEKFSYANAVAYRDDMLNAGFDLSAEETIFLLEGMDPEKEIFMRPNYDLKQFSGSVFTAQSAREFLQNAIVADTSTCRQMGPDTRIVVSSPKNIVAEWRWFIVGGKIVDGSLYRSHGQMVRKNAMGDVAHSVAEMMVYKWLPDECCVMDTALLDTGEYKVIEFNCLNGSGFYDNDIKKILTVFYNYHCQRDARVA